MNNAPASSPSGWQARLGRFWAARRPREKLMLVAAAVVVLAALLWQLGILPAWRTLQSAPQQQAQLDAQWQRMQALQAQSAALLGQARRPFDEAALRASLAPLGSAARLELQAQGAELTLDKASAQAVAAWLVQSRSEAGAVVRQAHLERGQHEGQAVWSGRLQLSLPER